MNYRKLGKTGLEISEISLGCVPLNDADVQTMRSVVSKAVDCGINYLDICPFPSPEARDRMGSALKGIRDKIMISGHYGITWKKTEFFKTRQPNLCKSSFEDLLSRLHTDHVDVLMLSWIDKDEDFEDAFSEKGYLDYALKLKREGKARVLALSTHRTSIAKKAIRSGHIDAIMFPINPAHDLLPGDFGLKEMWSSETYEQISISPTMERRELYLQCEEEGIGLIAMKPFAGGLLLHGGQIYPFLEGKGLEHPAGMALTPVQCVSYVLSQPGVVTALGGCGTAEELDGPLAYITASSEDKDFSTIDTAALWKLRKRCVYCNHCLPCPVGIEIGTVFRLLDAAEYGARQKATEQYKILEAKSSECTQCGICEDRCPFGVPVIEGMEKATQVFGE